MDPEIIRCVWNLPDPSVASHLPKRFEDYLVLIEIVGEIDAY